MVAEDGGDVIMELYNKELELGRTVTEERTEVQNVTNLDLGFQAFSQTMMAREYQLTSRTAFSNLQKELISTFITEMDDVTDDSSDGGNG